MRSIEIHIVEWAMKTLLSKLEKLVVDEYNLQKGVKEEIKKLQKELTYMNAALRKVSEVPVDQLDELVRIWAGDVRELSYDIEDAVDTFMVSCKKRKRTEPWSFKALLDETINLLKKAVINREIGNAIKDIMSQVKEAKERGDRYNIHGVLAKPDAVPVDLRIEAMFRKPAELAGIDGPKNELAKRLMKEDGSSRQQPHIISIVGFGGLGKTTLAKALFDELKAKFDCKFFVSVSLKPDIKMIFKRILSKLGRNDIINEACDKTQLIEKIRELLKNKRCLFVIDDIWEEQTWDYIKLALQDGNCGSKIILTTRKKDVAERAGGYVYKLEPLSNNYSKELLNMRIFGSKDGCLPDDLTEVARKILKKCGGVPLAIITTASLLANKPMHQQEWEKVNASIGTGMEKSLDVDKMSKILSLSYNDLPPHLKTCLLYLSKYPEDMKIHRDTLVSSWIAEGFITVEEQAAGARLQEVGESYFNELINRSLIQPVKENPYYEDGQVYYCRVHDMVLELLNQLSAKEGFVTTLFADGQQAAKIRRLSLHNSGNTFASPEARERLSQVRSLTVFGSVDSIPPLSSFPVLRVLQLEDCDRMENLRLKSHLKDLGNLRLLKFLRLYDIKEIPESIGNLQFLHTLDVTACYHHTKTRLPKSFVNLGQLVRLVCWGVGLSDGVALGNMKSLQEVVGIYVVTEYEMQEIGTLTELRVLHLEVDKDAKHNGNFREALLKCLQRCNKLQDIGVSISGESIPIDFMQGVPSGLQRFKGYDPFKAFPGWINSSLSSLATVFIVVDTCMRQEYLDTLAELPSLLFLRLRATHCPERKERIIIRSTGYAFRCLEHLRIETCCTGLTFQPGAMPKLQRLLFGFQVCQTKHFRDGFDFGLENLPSLRHATFCLWRYCLEDNKYENNKKYEPEAEAAVRKAFNDYPNHLTVNFLDGVRPLKLLFGSGSRAVGGAFNNFPNHITITFI